MTEFTIVTGIFFLLLVASTYGTWHETYQYEQDRKSRKRKQHEEIT